MTSINRARENILNEWKLLRHKWENTKSQWKDKAGIQFEKEYMEEFDPTVTAALDKLTELNKVISQAKRNIN